jgi:glycosyltransferase involved in cell wall biosynthesis
VNTEQAIGIFQAEWPLQSQTVLCVQMLVNAGFRVELFLYDTRDLAGLDSLNKIPEIRVHNFTREEFPAAGQKKFIYKLPLRLRRLKNIFFKTFLHLSTHLYRCSFCPIRQSFLPLPSWLIQRSEKIIEKNNFKYFIGIEKKGLSWAGRHGVKFNIPFIYHSLELYTYRHPDLYEIPKGVRTKIAEEYFHKKSAATIVQDPERGRILLQDNGLKETKLLYLPVSVLNDTDRSRDHDTHLHEKFHLPKNQILIIQFGLFYDRRYTVELVRTAQRFPENWSLVLHGYGLSEAYLNQIQEANKNNRVILSLELVPPDQIQNVINSAHIGLSFYAPSNDNDRLTAYASEKMALYQKYGLPFIAFDYSGYRKVAEQFKSGVVIQSLGQLPEAIEVILSSYEMYRKNAFSCFSECYDYAKNFRRVIDFLKTS